MAEEIIIDVGGCCCYENGKCLWTKRYYENNIVPDCEKVKNCYYKQFKRLEQENEQMKSALEKIRDLCIHYENTNDKCITNCYAHFIVTDLIQDKINEVLK